MCAADEEELADLPREQKGWVSRSSATIRAVTSCGASVARQPIQALARTRTLKTWAPWSTASNGAMF